VAVGRLLLLASVLLWGCVPPKPIVPPPLDQLTPLVGHVIAEPTPVLAADNRIHLVYELLLTNMFDAPATLDAVEVLNESRAGALIRRLDGPALASMTRPMGSRKTSTTLGPGQSGVVFMDVTFGATDELPRKLTHRLTVHARTGAPTVPVFESCPTDVSRRHAVVISPPLQGDRWVVGNGCCDTITPHRGALVPVNGTLHVPERFAIDFVQLQPDGRLYTGPSHDVSSYPYFGVPVLSVADGVVVNRMDEQPEQVPLKPVVGVTAENAGGNFLVVDIGHGNYAFYAHMQPGSVRARLGDRVKRGQVLGLLGNSGNTDAPHLHFHMMDGPAPLASNGLPYEFTSFQGQGVAGSLDPMMAGKAAPIDGAALAGPHSNQLPLNLQVISFPAAPPSQ
jgi:hypothetical protein